jgi:hypothetical protein
MIHALRTQTKSFNESESDPLISSGMSKRRVISIGHQNAGGSRRMLDRMLSVW